LPVSVVAWPGLVGDEVLGSVVLLGVVLVPVLPPLLDPVLNNVDGTFGKVRLVWLVLVPVLAPLLVPLFDPVSVELVWALLDLVSVLLV